MDKEVVGINVLIKKLVINKLVEKIFKTDEREHIYFV